MKSILLFTFLIASLSMSFGQTSKEKEMDENAVLRHVVLFQWNDGTSPEKVKEIEAAFAGLPAQIDEIIDFEYGLNNSPEGLDKGFTHCFLVTFATEEGRDIYLPHPAHQKFVKLVGDHVKDVLVVDYWSK